MPRRHPSGRSTPRQSDRAPEHRPGRFRRRLLAILVGFGAAFLLAEAGVRVFRIEAPRRVSKLSLIDRTTERKVYYDCYASNPSGEFRALPDVSRGRWTLVNNMLPPAELPLSSLRETPWCIEYEISPSGLRGPEPTPRAEPGILRIGLVGDSFVFGEGVPIEKTLGAQIPSLVGPGREILNLGWSGLDTRGELARLEAGVRAFQFDRAIVVWIANDIEASDELRAEQDYINDLIQVRDQYLDGRESRAWFAGPSRFVRFVGSSWDRRHVTEKTIAWYRDLYDPARNAPNLERLAESFRRMARIQGCRVVLALYPLLDGLDGEYPLRGVHERVARMAREAGLTVLDLAPAFAGRDSESLWAHPCDHHPNGTAHAIAAGALVEGLAREAPGFLEAGNAR
jgi:hypothetical protein